MNYLLTVLWIPAFLIKIVLAVLGTVVVPLALAFKVDMKTLPIWGNREGVEAWFFKSAANGEEGKIAEWFPRFWWHWWRNPVNNVRYWFEDVETCNVKTNWDFSIPMEAQQLIDKNRRMAFAWRWSGWKVGYRRVWLNDNLHYSEVWFGWKLTSRVPGLGFTSQWRPKRKIGT